MYPIRFDCLTKTAKKPERQHNSDVGYDIYSDVYTSIPPGTQAGIQTGITMQIPVGIAGLILPRSGLAAKYDITVQNSPGLIDPGYRGEIIVLLRNEGTEPFIVEQGMRIAQMVFMNYLDVVWIRDERMQDNVSGDRGANGFGSTGV